LDAYARTRGGRENLTRFMRRVAQRHDLKIDSYRALYDWSIRESEAFWGDLWDFCEVRSRTRGRVVVANGDRMPGATWFPEAQLNYAENLLRHCQAGDTRDSLVFWGEDKVKRRLSRDELLRYTSRFAQALRNLGIAKGDRVAGYLPNMPETMVAMLATASLGAIWSSASPDFGVQGVVDRFGQIGPKVLICADGYYYAGKQLDSLERIAEIASRLPSVERVIVVDYTRGGYDLTSVRNAVHYDDFLAPFAAERIEYAQVPFDHPLFILYSSGTTGVPKCIVHGHGGVLLQHLKEHVLHTDVKDGDRLFYFTTCGWMMWNWLASGLAAGATLLLFDGSPFVGDGRILFDYADAEGMTHFGTSAKYLDALAKTGLKPIENYRLASLRGVLSTGSPLAPESFDFVYRDIKSDVCLSSISGGDGHRLLLCAGEPHSSGLTRRIAVSRPRTCRRCLRRGWTPRARSEG
jgi:acetoacetyl-CoA synthetase